MANTYPSRSNSTNSTRTQNWKPWFTCITLKLSYEYVWTGPGDAEVNKVWTGPG